MLFAFGQRSFTRNNSQIAVMNMIIKRIVGKQNKTLLFNLTFRMFRHTSSEVTVGNRSNN